MNGKMKIVLGVFCVFVGIGLLGTLVDPEPIPKWRAYAISILYAIGAYSVMQDGIELLTPKKK